MYSKRKKIYREMKIPNEKKKKYFLKIITKTFKLSGCVLNGFGYFYKKFLKINTIKIYN